MGFVFNDKTIKTPEDLQEALKVKMSVETFTAHI